MSRLSALVSAWLFRLAAGKEYTCPEYSQIRQKSVDPAHFDINEIAGTWYLLATTEPTTAFCLCNVMNYNIYQKTYLYADTCFQTLPHTNHTNITMENMGGTLGPADSPGFLHEAFKIKNHSVTHENPTMIYDVKRDRHGKIVLMHIYACLGKLVPVVGKPMFSYLLYSRSPWLSKEEINALVDEDNSKGVFSLDGYVVTDPDTWRTCGVLPSKESESVIV